MNELINENNSVTLVGTLISDFKFDHEFRGEKFYKSTIAVNRHSENIDSIPFIISEKLIDIDNAIGKCVSIVGQMRSFNDYATGKSKLKIYVYTKSIEIIDIELDNDTTNDVILCGYLCKTPVLRKTHISKISICDLLLAVNRAYGKTDYLPCICWDKVAIEVSKLEIGACIKIYGRIQSREYQKVINENESEIRTAYEVSIQKIEII